MAETYRSMGYKAEIVASQGDHGVDLVLYSPNGEKQIVQCKRWKGMVGEPIVRDFYGAMQHENAVEGSIITAGTFTNQARIWAKDKPIRLYDGDEFLKLIRRAENRQTTTQSHIAVKANPAKDKPLYCPKCGASLVLRTARQGSHQGEKFYGCSNYPQCRMIMPVEEA